MKESPQAEVFEGFDEPPARRSSKDPANKQGIIWARYKTTNTTHCDECLAEVHDAWKNQKRTSAPNYATYRRTEGGVTRFLCWPHTVSQRERDGLSAIRRGS